MSPRYPLQFRDTDAVPVKAGAQRAEQETTPDRPLRCRVCGRLITTEAERCSIGGAHEHLRTNPAGYRYHFGCFRTAPGCGRVGARSAEHTWFAGCEWRVAICGGCGEHLGWEFSGAAAFFGLILERLVKSPD
jgi:hypothetical protein